MKTHTIVCLCVLQACIYGVCPIIMQIKGHGLELSLLYIIYLYIVRVHIIIYIIIIIYMQLNFHLK